ncbi:SGNH/GDSL hydrolase family protein [Streptomyces hokutonensis]|uniref:SGNH/GDSL hydrolase family protein n=1 Tax=Streptomyces hokutonensis TaxID=1306990 RepID=UPI0005B7FAF2|nr:SGNH/GDSL hydrolase family protein [Streptomyces hokutonensis]
MKTSVQAGVAGLLACGTLLTVVLVTRDGDDNHTGVTYSTTSKGPYVALGDSYTAGPGITDPTGTPAGCDRSAGNYPALVAAELGLKGAKFRDVSCSGATTSDLTASQHTDNGTNPPQLRALSSDTRLVTIGIGGNDIGFSSMIKRCVAMGALYRLTGSGKYFTEDAPCAREADSDSGSAADAVEKKIATAGNRLTRILTEVKRRSPEARVYVVSYPALLPTDSADCGRGMSLAPGDVTYLREKEQQLNTALRQRASEAGVGYVDTYTPSTDHNACTAKATRWIEPLAPENPAAPVHPNARGERGMADAVLRAVKSAL